MRALLAFKRGEPRVCSMVRAPTPEDEDRRRICRERKELVEERVRHVNRIKGLLFGQGVADYSPLKRNRRRELETLRTGDGRPLGPHLKAQIGRELDRLELLLDQIKAVEAVRDAMLAGAAGAERARVEGSQAKVSRARASEAERAPARTPGPAETPLQMLMDLKGVGPEFAAILWTEGLSRSFANRRQIAAYAGLAPTPWQSGSIDHEQGVSNSGNSLLRTTMIQMAWLWLRHQPRSALSRWFQERQAGVERAIARTVRETADKGAGKNARKTASKRARKTAIVALARKLLVALWKYVSAGVVIEEAEMKRAAAPV